MCMIQNVAPKANPPSLHIDASYRKGPMDELVSGVFELRHMAVPLRQTIPGRRGAITDAIYGR